MVNRWLRTVQLDLRANEMHEISPEKSNMFSQPFIDTTDDCAAINSCNGKRATKESAPVIRVLYPPRTAVHEDRDWPDRACRMITNSCLVLAGDKQDEARRRRLRVLAASTMGLLRSHPAHDSERMKQTTGQRQAAFIPMGEALVHAERCRGEGRLLEAEAVCRRILEVQPNLAGGRTPARVDRAPERQDWTRRSSTCSARPGSRRRSRCFTPISARCCGSPAGPSSPPKRRGARSRSSPTMAAALSNLGVALYELKDYEEAAQRASQGDRGRSDFRRGAQQSRQRAARACSDFDEAIASLSPRHRDSSPTTPTPGPISAPRCTMPAASTKAIVALRRAIALSPHHANAHSGLGILLLMRGDLGRGLGRIRVAAALERAQGPALPGTAVAGRKPRRQAHLRAGRAGFWRQHCSSPATCRCSPRAPAR